MVEIFSLLNLIILPVFLSIFVLIFTSCKICTNESCVKWWITWVSFIKLIIFIKENGLNRNVTQDSFVQILKKVSHRVEIDKKTGVILNSKRDNKSGIKNIWNYYDQYKKIVTQKF